MNVCVHFSVCVCVCIVCVRVCVTQPLPGISDGNTVRLQWTSSKDVNPNNQPYTLSLSSSLSRSQIHSKKWKQTSICTHAQSHTHGEEERPHREIRGIQMHACAWTMGGFYVSTLSPCFVQIIPQFIVQSSKVQEFIERIKSAHLFHRWLTMHICQTFIYRSIYFLFFKNLYEIYHIYIACDLKKRNFLQFVHFYKCKYVQNGQDIHFFLSFFFCHSKIQMSERFKYHVPHATKSTHSVRG